MNDILIKNAQIIDGTGAPAFKADMAVKDGKIVFIGKVDGGKIDASSTETFDADGLAVAPGFIDAHGHSDLFAFADPARASKLCQGITTEIAGQCGLGPAPVSETFYNVYEAAFKSLGAPVNPKCRDFKTFGAFMSYTEKMPLGINLAYFIPHGAVRVAVMGMSAEKPSAEQMIAMQNYIREGMEAGALGLSSGLMYAPGIFSDEEEMIELCKTVSEYGGIYTTHLRDQGNRVEESVAETIRAAKSAGVRANVSHNKASGKNNWGKSASTIKMIHDAQTDIQIMHDAYPYTASSTVLISTLPHYLLRIPHQEIIAYLNNRENRSALMDAVYNPAPDFESALYDCGCEGILITTVPVTKDAEGKTIKQYAEEKNIDQFDAYIKLLTDNNLSGGYIGFTMSQKDVDAFITDPLCMIGTDSLYVQGIPVTHPRAIGTFPRVIAKYVNQLKLLTLEEAVRKMTSLPAEFYSLPGKGILREGMDADIVIFDPVKITDRADFEQPLLPNEGIRRVIVGGKTAVADDKALNVLNGGTLRPSLKRK